MDIRDGLLGKVPFVTIVVAVVVSLVFVVSMIGRDDQGGDFEERLLRAQVFFERNPGLEVTARTRSLLGDEFVARVQADQEASLEAPTFSKRMRDRTQAKFDKVCDAAWNTRLEEDPVWSEGISGPGVPATRYLTYAFFHDGALAFGVTLAFLLLAGLLLEASWGALVQAPLLLVAIPLGGLVYAYTDAVDGVPLTGGGPMLAALLAAYLVRGFGGRLPVPGAILLPAWLFVDALFVRGIWTDNLGDWPITTLAVSMVFGAAVAGLVRLLGVDARLVDTVDSLADGVHPAMEAADRFRNLGRPADAFEALAEAAREEPSNAELVLAWWEIAIETGRTDEVAHAVLPVLQSELRTGDIEAATTHWRQVMASGASVQASTTLLVRMGEALLDAGEPEQALDTLRRALDAPGRMGSALAQRIVRIARDLDPVLTARAAQVALEDAQIDPEVRADLEVLAGASGGASATWSEATGAGAEGGALDDLLGDGPVGAGAADAMVDIDAGLGSVDAMGGDGLDEIDGLDTSEIDLSHVGDLASAEDFAAMSSGGDGLPPMGLDLDPGEAGGPEPVETDPNALSIQSIEREFAGGLEIDAQGQQPAEDPSSWNDVGLVEDLSGELEQDGPALLGENDLDAPAVDNSFLEAGALSLDALSAEATDDSGLDSIAPGRNDFSNDATDPMDLSMEPEIDDSTDALPPPDAPVAAQATPAAQEAPLAPETPPTEPVLDDPPQAVTRVIDVDAPGTGGPALRALKVLDAVPLALEPEALKFDVEGRGKTRLPFSRIDAVSVAAVSGLSAKPVLVIDFVLNWGAGAGESLKVIRIRSDGFNPVALVDGASAPLEGIKTLIRRVLDGARAMPLPDAGAVVGSPFSVQPDLASYERDVLQAG